VAEERPPVRKRPASGSSPERSESRPRPRRVRPRQLAQHAAEQLLELTGKQPEGVTGLHRTDDGWIVVVDVLELHRVPETTDVLASYEVEVDEEGELVGYRRTERFVRGSTEGRS
jgi:hypothetical protein